MVRDTNLFRPWLLTADDWPWLFNLTRRRYGPRYDLVTSEQWYRNRVLPEPGTFHPMRTVNAFCISMISWLPWLPAEPECGIVFICTDNGHMAEGITLLRDSIDWGRERRCAVWRMASETAFDLEPLAKRVGAKEASPRWTLRY